MENHFALHLLAYLCRNLENLNNWLLCEYTLQQLLLSFLLRLGLGYQVPKGLLGLSCVKFDAVDGGGRRGSLSPDLGGLI
jgi:hypothetical protein